jgi:hypothetical protein
MVVSRWTGIPLEKLSQSDRDRLLRLGPRLKERVVGQVCAGAVSLCLIGCPLGPPYNPPHHDKIDLIE